LQFNFNFTNNFTNIHLPNSVIKPRAIPDLTQPFQSEVQSAASALTAALPAAASKVQSGIGAAASKVQSGIGAAASDIDTIEARIPRNCSFGSKNFCVGSVYNTTCYNFPFNISDIIPEGIPEDVTSFIIDKVQFLKPLEGILAEAIIITIRGSLYLGLGCLALITALFFYFILKVLSVATLCVRLLICFSTILFFVLFAIATGILYHAQSKIQELGSIFGIEKGDMSTHYTVILICAGVMMLLTIFMSAFK
jgi:hypothetical protein